MAHSALGEFRKKLVSTDNTWGIMNSAKLANKYLHGIHPRYYLIGADSGVGKTTFADQYYVLEPIMYCIQNNIPNKTIYYSFEVSVEEKLYRWTSYFVRELFGVLLPPDYIAKRIHGMEISPEHMVMIDKAFSQVEKICEHIIFIEDAVHPTKMLEDLIEHHYSKIGTIERSKDTKDDKGKVRKGYLKGFKLGIPKYWTNVVVDHLALGGSEQGLETKGIMDRFSRHAVTLRNICKQTTVYLQQFNTDMMNSKRQAMSRKGTVTITPSRDDFGDSKYTYRDADVVWGLVKPSDFELQEWNNFKLSDEYLDNNMIAGFILKNRYGPDKRIVNYFINGVAGHLTELPLKPLFALNEMEEFYNLATKIEQTCQLFSQNQENQ
jgi:hypothetical protein